MVIDLARKRGEEVREALLAVREASAVADAPGSGCDRLAGLPAAMTITGDERALPSDVDRAAYRIIQEALTNVGRDAGPASPTVHINYGPDEPTVRVDDGRATSGAEHVPGVGLRGMRERITALGGRLNATPRPESGFTVRAELPIRVALSKRTIEHCGLTITR